MRACGSIALGERINWPADAAGVGGAKVPGVALLRGADPYAVPAKVLQKLREGRARRTARVSP